MSVPPLIEIRNATIWRGDTCVFENLNLTLPQQQQVAILGPNGSGKTTLLKVINRELYPVASAASTVRILGRDRWNVWELRRQIGLVSHDLQRRYTATTTALEVVLSGYQSSIGVHGSIASRVLPEQRTRAAAMLAAVGMSGYEQTALKAMSTGQQRRCLLARALVHRPATLILDEPTAGLDLAASFELLGRIRQLAASGQNLCYVTHHLSELPPEIERIILLRQGRIIADGPPAQTLTSEILSDVYRTAVRVARVDGYFLAYPG